MNTLAARIASAGSAVLLLSATACDPDDSRVLALVRSLTAPRTDPAPADPPPPPARQAAPAPGTPAAGSREIELLVGGEVTSYVEPEAEPTPLYGYVDASGSMRMVRGLDAVPPAYRQQARDLSSVASFNRIETLPAQAPRRRVIDWQPAFNPHRFDAVLYSSESCGACARARAYLDARGVSYALRDIQRDPGAREEVRRILGRVAVPLLGVDGTWVSGFSPDAINRALGLDP